MPATTRSKSRQSHLEDFQESEASEGSKDTQKPPSKSSNKDTKKPSSSSPSESKSKKRKSTTTTANTFSTSSKNPRQGEIDKSSGSIKSPKPSGPSPDTIGDDDNDNDTITINRSPVLQLWSACVARHIYPNLSWSTDLAIGSAISTLCAIAKGKSIGMIDEREKSPEEKAEQSAKRRAAEAGADREVQVMGFRLYVQGEDVMLQGTPKRGNEGLLRNKFGRPENYDRTKKAMDDAIETWTTTTGGGEGHGDELDSKAFHMYEQFRPSVQGGQSGWGKKGALKLSKVREVVARAR